MPSTEESSPRLKSSQEAEARLDVEAPKIPINPDDAFFPLRYNPETKKYEPSYQWNECVKRFVVCIKWEKKRVYFPDLEWFYLNGWGLSKQRRPGE
jgi:hypothetical protein